jgi:replicative DNA helicase
LSYRASKTKDDAFDLMDWSEGRIFGISRSLTRKNFASSEDATNDAVKSIENMARGGFTGPLTGNWQVDDILGGFQPGELTILAGRPSNGKTAYGVKVGNYNASKGRPVGIFSLEMSINQLIYRQISFLTRINGQRIAFGKVTNDELNRIREEADRIKSLPLYYDDCGGISIGELKSKIRRLRHERGVELIVIDYLQLISGNRKDSREQEISSISRTLKGTAKDLGIPILCLSQLSRAIDTRIDKRPILSDLRESGAIEQDADNVLFVHSPSLADDYRDIIVSKHRNGPVGEARLHFRGDINEFRDYVTNPLRK